MDSRFREHRLPCRITLVLLASLVLQSRAETPQIPLNSVSSVDTSPYDGHPRTLSTSDHQVKCQGASRARVAVASDVQLLWRSRKSDLTSQPPPDSLESPDPLQSPDSLQSNGELIEDGEGEDEFLYIIPNPAPSSEDQEPSTKPNFLPPQIRKGTSYFWTTNDSHIFPVFQAPSVPVLRPEACKDWLQGPKAQAIGLVCLFLTMVAVFEGISLLFRRLRPSRHTGRVTLQGRERQLRAFTKDMEAGF